jgi:hypothetical protein
MYKKSNLLILIITFSLILFSIIYINNTSNISIAKKLKLAEKCLINDEKYYIKIKCATDIYSNPKNLTELKEMMDLLIKKADKNNILASACHDILHELGSNAYNEFQDESLLNNYYTCGFGYLHGVMSSAINEIGETEKIIKKLNQFCINLEDETKGTLNQCHHGIGHAIGSNDNTIIEQTKLCELLESKNPRDTTDCVSGSYNQYFLDRTLENSGNIDKSINLCENLIDTTLLECTKFALMYTNLPSYEIRKICEEKIMQNDIYSYYGCLRSSAMLAVHNELTNIEQKKFYELIDEKIDNLCSNINMTSNIKITNKSLNENENNEIIKYMKKNPCYNQFFNELYMKIGDKEEYEIICSRQNNEIKKECEDILFLGSIVYDIRSVK